jgi:hypothetical protein
MEPRLLPVGIDRLQGQTYRSAWPDGERGSRNSEFFGRAARLLKNVGRSYWGIV